MERKEVINPNSTGDFSIYEVRHYFRARRIDPESEPPEDLIEDFLIQLTESMIHQGWSDEENRLIPHRCTNRCTLETFIVIGRPFTYNVLEAVKW